MSETFHVKFSFSGFLVLEKIFKVAHYIKFVFNGSIKPLLLAMISQSKNLKKLPIILYDFFVIFLKKTKNVFCL
jgi:hypothetical protein